MTLDRAIEMLQADRSHLGDKWFRELDQAKELGIEALKAWKEFRGSGSLMDKMLLPGETED